MARSRVEFRLTMPGRGSWNGKWSGEQRNYYVIRSLSQKMLEQRMIEPGLSRLWTYAWKDGWVARVTARILAKGERLPKSDGFCGYDWMVDSILEFGVILATDERKRYVAPVAHGEG